MTKTRRTVLSRTSSERRPFFKALCTKKKKKRGACAESLWYEATVAGMQGLEQSHAQSDRDGINIVRCGIAALEIHVHAT